MHSILNLKAIVGLILVILLAILKTMTIPAEHIDKFLAQLDINAIKDICKPLETHFGLTSFVYRKNYNDGTEINISNQPEWVRHFYTDKTLIEESSFDQHPDMYQSGFVLWSQLKGHQVILEHARHFNIDHGVTIIRKVPDGVEFGYFGTKSECPTVIGNYINNIDLLERFILYFKEKASTIIDIANQNRILVPNKFARAAVRKEDMNLINPKSTRDDFLKATEVDQFHFEQKCKGLVLSAREIQIIEHLLKGMTSDDIGKAIFLSARTVEDYLSQLRDKFQAKNKAQLIKKLMDSEFIAYLPHK